MVERPFDLRTPAVQAVLEGHKTQERRLRGLNRPNESPSQWHLLLEHNGIPFVLQNDSTGELLGSHREIRCPYGQVGDKLWVRETWAKGIPTGASIYADRITIYRADGEMTPRWYPSIHMPRSVSRITLEITGVRVERLQEISSRDAYAEGVIVSHDPIPVGATWEATVGSVTIPAYRRLWDSINGKTHPWAENPWVWVIEFKRLRCTDGLGRA